MSIYASWEPIGLTEDEDFDGTVLEYLSSNRHPAPSDIGASVWVASIPAWCVPGCDDEESGAVGEYLRLDVSGSGFSTVVLTVAGAVKLRDQLTEWLAMEKVPASRVSGEQAGDE